MGSSQNKTKIIWISQSIESKENKIYREELKRHKEINLECFNSLEPAFKIIKKIKFQNTIIITGKGIFPDFYKEFKKNYEENILFIPKIIIFTSNAKEYILNNKKSLPLNNPFYNSGGVTDSWDQVKKFIESSMNSNSEGFGGNNDENFQFQNIKDKNDLILPLFYPEYIEDCSEDEIKDFNEKIYPKYKDIPSIEFIFSQLSSSGNLPINLLCKYWLRAYSTHNSFSKNMNEELKLGRYNDYSSFIKKLYKSVEKGIFKTENGKLYKGIVVDKNKWEIFLKEFKETKNNLPTAILYGSSFFSFYKDENIVKKSKENRKGETQRFDIFIWLELEGIKNFRFIKNQVTIDKEISFYNSYDEILFFPFTCFEIKQIKKIQKKNDEKDEYIMTLNYLEKYTNLFTTQEKKTFENVPENEYSKMVIKSGLIDEESIDFPSWRDNETKIIPNNFNIKTLKKINDSSLNEQVEKICLETMNENNNNNLEELRMIIQNKLKEYLNVNWYVKVSNELLINYGNIDPDSVMIFQYYCSSDNCLIIHVAKLNS